MTNLSDAADDVLEASLVKLYLDHTAAMEAGDTQARAEIHWAVTAVIAEQSRRLDTWINDHLIGATP